MLTPEEFSRRQQQFQRQEDALKRENRKKYTKSVNLKPIKTPSFEIPQPVQDDEEVLDEIEENPVQKEEEAETKASSGGAKIGAQIAENIKARYLREIKEVLPEMKKQFWLEYRRMGGNCFSAVAIKGWRDYMEDTMDSFHTQKEEMEQLFAVYDGHGGDECSLYCEKFMLKRIAMHSDLKADPKAALLDSFVKINDGFSKSVHKNGGIAGSTATVLYVTTVPSEQKKGKRLVKYYLSYVGDSRAILVYKDGKVVPLSQDHLLTRKDELERIKSLQGEIRYDEEFDETLVYNSNIDKGLAVTRSIGDLDFKPHVTAVPEISEGYLDENCAYICLATDGLWAKISNQKVGDILCEHGMDEGMDLLANLANARSVFDNITILVVDCPKLILELQEYDKKVNA